MYAAEMPLLLNSKNAVYFPMQTLKRSKHRKYVLFPERKPLFLFLTTMQSKRRISRKPNKENP